MTVEPSDEELMLLYQHGSLAAGAMLFKRYQGPLFGYVLRLVRQRSDSEEVLQNIFLRMHDNRGQYRAEGRFKAWIYRIATTQVYNFLDARRRRQCHLSNEEPPEDSFAASSVDCDPREVLQTKALADRVERAIAELPEEYRTIFLLRQREGLSYEELAGILGHSEGSLRVRFHRARNMLYESMRTWFEEDES